MAKSQSYEANIPKRDKVATYKEYWDFINWVAQPTPLRNPKTQIDLAKQLSLHNTTLSRWRRIEGFQDDVIKTIRHYSSDDIANVIGALKNQIYREGKGADVKVWLEWATQFAPTSIVKHTGEVKTTDEKGREALKVLVDKFEQALKEQIKNKK